MRTRKTPASLGGVSFHNPVAFWVGAIAITAGVIGHLPMYLMGAPQGYRLVGMPMDLPMLLGMFAIVFGLVLSLYGLYPRGAALQARAQQQVQVQALDQARLGPAHIGLLLTMSVAVTIDIMKPTALAFVMPGMTLEYGLKSPLNPGGSIPAAWVALSGIVGTVAGSFLWGWLGDRIGRRASILYAGLGFIGTSICGAMPDFGWNLAMCFLMGLAVGGMLPICYTLLAETMPARHRGWLMILVGADIAGAYIITSWLAAELVPTYSWRILWLIGLPTGVVFILLNRWIPESPRFLVAQGRDVEARSVMQRCGASWVSVDAQAVAGVPAAAGRWRELAGPGLLNSSLVVGCLGLGSGLVLFGFNLWIPTNLRKMGLPEADAMLRNAALIGLPLTFALAWLYGFWSTRKTIILLTGLTALSLFGFALMGESLAQHRTLLYTLLVVPVWGISGVVAVLSVYSSEVYPTRVRSRGTGFAAGASKAGGVAIIALVVAGVATPSISTVAMIGAVPMALAALLMLSFGVETRKRGLEDIAAQVALRSG